tara:strand:+ start:222 stop:836 length:615 start_codon:yes stop_codon:yes gene_type:complete
MNEHYDGFAVYRKYLAYKLHFTTDKYDYTEHSGMIHTKLETFTKRNDRYMFHKLSVKYNQDEIDDFMIANFLKKNKAWSGSLLEKESHEIYLQYKRRTDSSSYFFKEDCSRILTTCDMDGIMPTDVVIVRNGQHPILLRHCIGNKISTETLIIMDYHLNFIKDWQEKITDKIVWPNFYKKITKFKPFLKFNQTETKLILREVFL